MSVSLYRWTEACEGVPCPGDCDLCSREEEEMSDLISRRAAIEAMQKAVKNIDSMNKADIVAVIAGMPSAQPEIIRCRDCKHFEYDHPYIIQGVPVLGHEVCNAWGDGCKTDENGYCYMAERRTDE